MLSGKAPESAEGVGDDGGGGEKAEGRMKNQTSVKAEFWSGDNRNLNTRFLAQV